MITLAEYTILYLNANDPPRIENVILIPITEIILKIILMKIALRNFRDKIL